jgi:Asp-tRNA(Asn)/Glu-tRNA(Gln) amidotransferase A subunit family amidase
VASKLPERLNELTASEISRRALAGEITCETIARACLERTVEREPLVHAWHYFDAEQVLQQARALDRGAARGPLFGVPFGAKDIIDSGDMPTEYGTTIHRGHRPAKDAACVALSRKAGALLFGKTDTTEFANIAPGSARNPHDVRRTPGGSSSGSAAAVAEFMVPLALGTQTTGSVTRPSSFCGVFGYRPTYGDLRMAGVMEASGSLDTLGICARSIDDIALYRDVLVGASPRPIEGDRAPPRIGFCRPYFWSRLTRSTQRLLEDAARSLEKAGAVVEEMTLPEEFAALEQAHKLISGYEMARNLAWELQHHADRISDKLRFGRLKDGMECSVETYSEMRRNCERLRARMQDLMARYDVVLAPAGEEAPIGNDPVPHPWMYMAWTIGHVPTITLPVFKGPDGMPVGMQVLAPRYADRALLAHARWIYEALT